MFWQCRRVFGLRWGLTPRAIYWIYTMMIRPAITYASIVWWQKAEQKTAKEKLGRLQRIICVGILGAMRTTPNAAMEALLSLTPLDICRTGSAPTRA